MMDLRKEILREHSSAQRKKIVRWVGSDQQRFNELFFMLSSDEQVIAQRAAWPVSYCVNDHPHLIRNHWKKVISLLQQPVLHHAVKRNLLRFMQHVDIPKRYQGKVIEICFHYVADPARPVAIRVFSMQVLSNLARQYPGIKNELQLVLENNFEKQSAGFKSRAAKVFKKLAQL
jgi:hypothetical protein